MTYIPAMAVPLQDVLFCAGETADAMSFVVNGAFLYRRLGDVWLVPSRGGEVGGSLWLTKVRIG